MPKKSPPVKIENDIPVFTKGATMNDSNLTQERTHQPVHETRAYETWTDEAVHAIEDKPWEAPTSLKAPTPRAGFVQRWIRVGMFGNDDATNAARKAREGWRPRMLDTVPAGFTLPSISHGQWAGCIGVEGMILCEMPEQLAVKRRTAIRAKTDNITESLATELQQQSHAAMPITQSRSSKLVREVRAADD